MDLIFKLNEILECPICLATFQKPICLDCGHVLCKQCIKAIQTTARENCSRTFMCPFCRKRTSNRVKRTWDECEVIQKLLKYTSDLKKSYSNKEYEFDFSDLSDDFLNSISKI